MNLTNVLGVAMTVAGLVACGRPAIHRDASAHIEEWPTYG